jgi:hypothetical protein
MLKLEGTMITYWPKAIYLKRINDNNVVVERIPQAVI